MSTVDEIRNAIWAAIETQEPSSFNQGSLQSGSILQEVKQQIQVTDIEAEQRILTVEIINRPFGSNVSSSLIFACITKL